ncbi:hypothetical protein C8R43DRAFT_992643 [Mycena crocata]|nr:hypothetical protein C8R43DRAFT_1013344 [Mycena crocata]KAJ7161381.1 hypothetical protein C8R43DRAFT_992643 [Mycena crocata]
MSRSFLPRSNSMTSSNAVASSSRKRPTENNLEVSKRRKTNSGTAAKVVAAVDESTSVPKFANYLSDEQKTLTLRHMLLTSISNPLVVSSSALLTIASEHNVSRKKRALLVSELEHHSCSWSCLVRSSDALHAGQLVLPIHLPTPVLDRSIKPLPKKPLASESLARKNRRDAAVIHTEEQLEADRDYWAKNWPQLESEDSLKNILREHRSQTTSRALLRRPCSFCNRDELVDDMKLWTTSELDISLLERAVEFLRIHSSVPNIQSHSLHDGQYQACTTCARCVKNHAFVSLPLFSWANGCWIGPVPGPLSNLTYAEELVIARAHTTKCWAKINAGSGPRILRQRAASGNVCIHPHEISAITTILPRPMSTLYDEIVVIFVTDDDEATAEMFKRTPFLVRRGHILLALNWLKIYNFLYYDIIIDYVALAEYPEDGCVPFPVQHQLANETIRGQNATYTGHGIDTTEAIFAEHTETNAQIPISMTGTFDVENSEIALNDRKIQALRQLKAGGSFLKTSTTAETLSTRQNPNVYSLLWPTLFPYGVGMFDDPVRLRKDLGFKPIMLKSHVQHLLQIEDRRFQIHLTFPFAMHNIQMIRKSSFQSRLAVRRAWWPLQWLPKKPKKTIRSMFPSRPL